MKRQPGRIGSLTLLAVVCLLAAPAWSQETIRGVFEGQQFTGQQHTTGNVGTGVMVLRGWALATSGVRQVIIQVDGADQGAAIRGRVQPEITRDNPGFPDSPAPGWTLRLDSPRFPNGTHRISAKVITNNGNVRILDGTRDFVFNNNVSLLVPFGAITHPQRNAQIFGTCDTSQARRRVVPIEGWALDLGLGINDTGIGWVELMIDGQPPSFRIYNTREGCRFIFDAGGFTNCYGLPRPEIEHLYPFAIDAPNAGFRFVLDVGALITEGLYSEGQHLITIRANDESRQLADIFEMPVVFRCIEGVPNEGAFGFIESPRQGVVYSGRMPVQGWALDEEGVDVVRVFIDGVPVGEANYGVEDGILDTRPGVFSRYPGFPDVIAPVFRLIPTVDTTTLSDGRHQLQIFILDREGDTTLIGEVSFFVNNRDDG